MNPAPGQRWISTAEPELGLGTVLRCDPRNVQMLFAKTGVLRHYAQDSAPLLRAEFRVGQRISGKGRALVIQRIEMRDLLLVYSGDGMEMHEGELDDEQPVSRADERLMSGRVDDAESFTLRIEALLRRQAARRSACWGVASARVDLIPHQLQVAEAGANRRQPRLLLADEVGLGKTIEAGLIVSRLLATGRIARVLVLVPDSLVHQWLVEMLRRFNLRFAVYDEPRCESLELGDAERNPFDDAQWVIAPLDWLANSSQRSEQVLQAGWDLLVVDEAHHLQWTPDQVSAKYALVERLAGCIPGLILLTATPEQLGRNGHFARLRLLDPARYVDLDQYHRETDDYANLSALTATLESHATLSAEQHTNLQARLAGDASALAALNGYPNPQAAEHLLSALIDRHGVGRVMFRNLRQLVGGFPGRQYLPQQLASDDEEQRQRLLAEFLSDVQQPPSALDLDYSRDPRIEWLLTLLQQHPQEKFLLIARSESKVLTLEDTLRTRSGENFAKFCESMTLLQRDRAAAWFSEPDGARLLLCSEIGSEGRNFQFAHHLLLWDLPLDPDLLEQRIGRLDRIGQQHLIQVHHFALSGSAQEALARWFDEGMDAFRAPPADARTLLLRHGETLRELAVAHARGGDTTDQELDSLLAETQASHAELAEDLAQGRDHLLEMATLRAAPAQALRHALQQDDADTDGHTFVLRLFEHFGIHHEALDEHTWLLDPEYLHTDALSGFAEGPLQVSFNRHHALAREDLPLLRLDHPLVHETLDLLLSSEHGNASFILDNQLAPRNARLEAVFVLDCVAAPELDAARFLPPTPIRICVDTRLQACPQYTPSTEILHRAQQRPQDPVRSRHALGKLVPPMLQRTEQLAATEAEQIIATAQATMQELLEGEITRLKALQAVNPGMGPSEVERIKTEYEALGHALGASRPRLDALRFAASPDFLALR